MPSGFNELRYVAEMQGKQSANLRRAIPLSKPATCAETPMRGFAKNGIAKPLNRLIRNRTVSEAFTTDQLRELYDVNVFGVQRVLRSVLPSFRSQGQGLVINIGSTVGRLMASINRFVTTPPASHSQYSHSFFGKLTSQQWAALIYKHLDHHLRQFGV